MNSHTATWTEGNECYSLAQKLWPLCRSLTGPGVRQSLSILQEHIPLKFHEVPSGTKCFDWEVPKEWTIREAWVKNGAGEKIVDFAKNNLHVVGYSTPVKKSMSLQELQNHLHSLPELPQAIPYITSYYQERWGFCLTHNQRSTLKEDTYEVYIDSDLKEGSLTYGEFFLPGSSSQEIFLSTYICHPSMGNNELSGPVLATALARLVEGMPNRKFSYRFVFIPETIGSICYLSRNYETLKQKVVAGFNLTCVGDDKAYSFLPSRLGKTLTDRVALHVLNHSKVEFRQYSFLDRGSDERQYCSPGIDLPIVSIMRSKYGEYPEYHTSLDDLSFISPKGFQGSFDLYRRCIESLESNETYKTNQLCEPQLGKRGLYPTLGTRESKQQIAHMMNFLAYCDGQSDLLSIAENIRAPVWDLIPIVQMLLRANLIHRL